MKTIIAGSRTVTDMASVETAIDQAGWDITEVVSGGARGVDRLGEGWARAHGVPIKQFLPDWHSYGRAAGFRRNADMARYAEALVAVWDNVSRGTDHMIKEARRLGRIFLRP